MIVVVQRTHHLPRGRLQSTMSLEYFLRHYAGLPRQSALLAGSGRGEGRCSALSLAGERWRGSSRVNRFRSRGEREGGRGTPAIPLEKCSLRSRIAGFAGIESPKSFGDGSAGTLSDEISQLRCMGPRCGTTRRRYDAPLKRFAGKCGL